MKTEQKNVYGSILSFSDLERCIENMQLKNKTKIANLDLKKREICVSTKKAVQEMKTFVDDAYAGWIKRSEQTHEDSVRILEVAYDELKRFSTTVHETKILLQSMLEKGYSKQLLITKQIQFARIIDHINRMEARDFWNFPEEYIQEDTYFLMKHLNQGTFEYVKLSISPSGTVEPFLQSVLKAFCNDILGRKHEMSNKDWMKDTFRLASQVTNLPGMSFYGVFIHDINIIFSFTDRHSLRIFDLSKPDGKCISH